MARSVDKIPVADAALGLGAYPDVALLSNGRYSAFVTEAGAGYGTWLGLDVTRWREDATRDCWGQFCYIRDVENGQIWAIGRQPICRSDAAYEQSFHANRAAFRCHLDDIDVSWTVFVATDCDAEVRLLRLSNLGVTTRELELTSYAEVCLNGRHADSAHPAFAKLFIETWFDAGTTALFARRRPRSAGEKPLWAVHVSASSDQGDLTVEHDTDRYRFLGRGNTPSNPQALEQGINLSGTTGPVLDPIFSLRRTISLSPSAVGWIAFVTGAADTKDEVQAIAERFANIDAAHRALLDAKTAYANEAGSCNRNADKVAVLNRLAARLAFAHYGTSDAAVSGMKRLSRDALWSVGISGDLPILLALIDRMEETSLVEELAEAHAFISHRGLPFDLVLIDEHGEGESCKLKLDQEELGKRGGVHVLSGAALAAGSRDAITAAARVTLCCSQGSLANQIEPRPTVSYRAMAHTRKPIRTPYGKPSDMRRPDLLFWNGRGGFAGDGREYVIAAHVGAGTPTPWCNVIANSEFGCLTSESALGYTWAGNSQLNRLSPWSNDLVSNSPSEVIYLRDERTGALWTPTPLPLGQHLTCMVTHGQGYTRYEGAGEGVHHEMTVHVPVSEPIKLVRLALRNDGTETRDLTATFFVEWVLGTLREEASGRVVCECDPESGALIARNVWEGDFTGKIAFIAASVLPRSITCDRTEFLGKNGSVAQPSGLASSDFSGSVDTHGDPCAAMMVEVSVLPGRTTELVFALGQTGSLDEVRRLVRDYVEPRSAQQSLTIASTQWDRLLSAITVRTPDAAFDVMMNRWLLYQVLACRIWARTGFYQSGGAYGFRDQLQDVTALVHSAPDEARSHILRAAARQFTEGDVQHWWHPPSGVGVRTRMTDDLYFLPFVVHNYVSVTGDYGLLSERVPFITSPVLNDEQEESFGVPQVSEETGTVYDHCCRALERGFQLGYHGLPLMGTGDWNDGMNRVGAEGKGESVWNGWFFLTVLNSFATLASATADENRAAWCRERAEALRVSLETHAWDGSWYRRAYFDDGTPLGSSMNDECQIDAIPQAWAVISGIADAERSSRAMQAVWERLVRPEDKLVRLFDPPFDKGSLQPGYIKGYVPGIRENGGQYTHAAAWVALATALLGDGDRAFKLWSMLNPVNHALTSKDADHYMVEPYVVSADVYGAAPHTGRGGWTWYTGSAGWLYRVGLEAILGIHRCGQQLSIEPCIPIDWPGYEVDYRYGTATYRIDVKRSSQSGRRLLSVDGIQIDDEKVLLVDDGRIHAVKLVVG
ncbi:glycosyl transferase [Rhizobium sp. ARZ01]|uniref:GH36-type glycosyl hydrolase domain-containing protein n=1 Tax=Rhizobium sp. ARZ01 TaxID=2769313 RepID=UPI00177FC5D6|nr:glycosyl transferase [Rhizobium sp. ARZ01]MBD9373066.1 glycosyl transferase [Rhizobium sp. ARZ01]